MLVATEQTIRLIGIDIGKNSFHIVGLDYSGAIVFRQFAHRSLAVAVLRGVPQRTISAERHVSDGERHVARQREIVLISAN